MTAGSALALLTLFSNALAIPLQLVARDNYRGSMVEAESGIRNTQNSIAQDIDSKNFTSLITHFADGAVYTIPAANFSATGPQLITDSIANSVKGIQTQHVHNTEVMTIDREAGTASVVTYLVESIKVPNNLTKQAKGKFDDKYIFKQTGPRRSAEGKWLLSSRIFTLLVCHFASMRDVDVFRGEPLPPRASSGESN
jgi:hypothetical protein